MCEKNNQTMRACISQLCSAIWYMGAESEWHLQVKNDSDLKRATKLTREILLCSTLPFLAALHTTVCFDT